MNIPGPQVRTNREPIWAIPFFICRPQSGSLACNGVAFTRLHRVDGRPLVRHLDGRVDQGHHAKVRTRPCPGGRSTVIFFWQRHMKIALTILIFPVLCVLTALPATSADRVKTANGVVESTTSPKNGVRSFKGIPFG